MIRGSFLQVAMAAGWFNRCIFPDELFALVAASLR